MTKTWLDKLCDPLENPQYPKGYGRLYVVDYDDNIVSKCAEGEIACQNGLKLGIDRIALSSEELREIGIPNEFIWDLPQIDFDNKSGEPIVSSDDLVGHGLNDYLLTLNDAYFTYPQIVEFLRTTFGDAV